MSPTTYRCPGCGAQLELAGPLLLCPETRAPAHLRDLDARAYRPTINGRLKPASLSASPWMRPSMFGGVLEGLHSRVSTSQG